MAPGPRWLICFLDSGLLGITDDCDSVLLALLLFLILNSEIQDYSFNIRGCSPRCLGLTALFRGSM